MQDLYQQIGDHRDPDLDHHGIFTAEGVKEDAVEVPTVHQHRIVGLEMQGLAHMEIMHPAILDNHRIGDHSAMVQSGVQLQGPFAGAESRPRITAQAQRHRAAVNAEELTRQRTSVTPELPFPQELKGKKQITIEVPVDAPVGFSEGRSPHGHKTPRCPAITRSNRLIPIPSTTV